MPTFNQLVRKGREKQTYKSASPAMQKGLNTLKNRETDLSAPPETRCVHGSQNIHAEKAEFRAAENRPCPFDKRL